MRKKRASKLNTSVMQTPAISPGTVSKILWHFTGGPTWNAATRKQNTSAKPAEEAHRNLVSIIRTKQLRLGNSKEVVTIQVSRRRMFDSSSRQFHIEKDVPAKIESSSVCCLSDIPAPHLHYHAHRYGKFAIGFHRDAVIKHGFNAVFYTLEESAIIQSIYEGFLSVDSAEPWEIANAIGGIESVTSESENGSDRDPDILDEMNVIASETEIIEEAIGQAKQSLRDFVAFVKTFSRSEFSTIYCEREWRSTEPYSFKFDDIAMIVLPRRVGQRKYYEEFIEKVTKRLKFPRRIPIVPWDDLVEH